MKTKLISIIIGLVLVFGVGTLVYKTKQPIILPSEDATTNGSALNNNTAGAQNQIPTKENSSTTTSKNKFWSDDEDDDDDYKGNVTTSTPTTVTPNPATTPTITTNGITLATIAKHSSRSSCWSAVNGGVYDLTSWIPNHPGGEQAILWMCGKDGSDGYNSQHSSEGKPAKMLAGFKIGSLSK